MTKKEYWELFRKTGKIEYYLEYKKLTEEDGLDDKKNRRYYSKWSRL